MRSVKYILAAVLVLVLCCIVFIALAVAPLDRPSTFTAKDKELLREMYPDGHFISKDIYERCEPQGNTQMTFWYYADGRRLYMGRECWK